MSELYNLNRYEFSRLSSFFDSGIINIYSGKIGVVLKVKTDKGLNKLYRCRRVSLCVSSVPSV